MFSRKFKACIWKTYRARKASKILTILEIVFPVILFGVLSFIHFTDIKKYKHGKNKSDTYTGESYDMRSLIRRGFEKREHIDIIYTSPTNNSNKIMSYVLNNVFRKYEIEHKIRIFEAKDTEIKVVSWLTTNYFKEDISDKAKSVGFGFVFRNEEQPQEDMADINVQYKIFCTLTTIKTDIIFPYYINQGRGTSGDAYITSGVAVLQWHVEKAIIEILVGEHIPLELELRSFPYPKGVDEGSNEFMYITILLPLFTMMSFIFFIPVVIRRVVQEKSSGVKELMRIMGLNSWYIWSTWLINCMLVFSITTLLTAIVLVMPIFGKPAFLDYVDFSVLWAMFFLFCVSSVILCFFVSAFFNNAVAAMSCGVILWIGTFTVLNQLISSQKIPWIVKLIVCIFPTAAITAGFNILDFYDNRNELLTWSEIFESHQESKLNFTMAEVFLMFFVDIVLFGLITWYFDRVKPGPFGIARPWNFLCKPKQFIRKSRKKIVKCKEYGMYEEPSPYLKVGIYISNLRKVYKDDVIGLDGVNMNLYKDVITVLLGHNGAGKTSLMGIISGLHSPTSGSVIVGGEDIFSNMKKFHRNLGICFQYNYLFDYLNVFEHFIFFGMVKGMTLKKAKEEGMALMKELNLLDNKLSMIHTMSGGMLRRLSLAIALIANPKVLFLDEPTSGLDPETRRDVWDLILKKRGSHTIVITTQFMEEADVLGDWIAIMDHGKIVCYGTTPFLKQVYGTGYHLTIAKDKGFNGEAISRIVKEHVPQSILKGNVATQVNYTLPLESTNQFPGMFTALEHNKLELGIDALDLQCTTMEEVFLKVGEILQGPKSVSFTGFLLANLPKTMGFKDNLKGSQLQFQQFKALFVKTLIFDLRNLLLLLFMALIPVAIVLIAYPSNANFHNSNAQPELKVALSMYGRTTVFFSILGKEQNNYDIYKTLQEKYELLVESQKGKPIYTDNVTKALLNFGDQSAMQFRMQTIVSTAFNETNIQAYFNNIPLHAVPISINLATNSLLKYLFPNTEVSVSFTYIPIDASDLDESCAQVSLSRGDSVGHQWAISMPQCLLCVMTVFLLLPAVERSSKCKHLQLMTGVPPLIYWLACFIWDFFIYTLVTLLLIITIILSDKHNIFSSSHAIGILVLILLLYGLSGTFYAYFSSNFGALTSRIIGNYLVFSICFGMISAILMNVATKRDYDGEAILPHALLQLLNYFLPLCPHYCLVSAFIRYGAGVYQNYLCNDCSKPICQEELLLVMNSKKHPNGILLELIFLALDWILYLVLLIMVDNKIFHYFFGKIKDSRMNFEFDKNDAVVSSDVHKEKEKTLACSRDRSVDSKAIFLCVGLGKMYSKTSRVLQPMSFRVRKGECFGLLGTNGAGKSTTFKLLVGDVKPSVGDAVNFNYTLMRNRTKYLSKIGYCPQMGALNLSFTGEETLRLYAQLRGIHPRRVETEVDNWIRLLGLSDYRSQVCGTYSSGNLRKLSTAVALIGHPPVVFLDEPTAGVDPFGRRNLWEVLNASKDHGQAIILTSHSMQECEALCTRLTIVVKGKMMCLGNTQYLKKKFGQGYTVALVLHTKPELQDTIPLLKTDMYKFFQRVKLKDEHKKLLHFHIKDEDITFSRLFKFMEELKHLYPVIDTYTLGDTTLEQVFISFAKSHIRPEIIL